MGGEVGRGEKDLEKVVLQLLFPLSIEFARSCTADQGDGMVDLWGDVVAFEFGKGADLKFRDVSSWRSGGCRVVVVEW